MRISRLLLALASLVALLGVLPVFLFLDLPAQLLFPLALIAGWWGDRSGRQPLSDRWATLASILLALFYLLQISSARVVEPLVNLLVLLQAVRLAGSKSARHLLQIFVLALFTLAASSLLTLNMAYLIFLLLQVGLVTVGLFLLTFYSRAPQLSLQRHTWRPLLGTALVLPCGSLVLMLFFFVLLPRTEHPLWDFLNPGSKAKVGFSDQVRPGSVSSLSETGAIAFRAESQSLAPEQLYWRGLVLNRTDGSSWRRTKDVPVERVTARTSIPQTIFLEPKADRYLIALDQPLRLSGLRKRRDSDLVLRAYWPLSKRVSYRVESQPEAIRELVNPARAGFYLQLPSGLSGRLRQLARELRAENATRGERITALEDFFRLQKLSYSSKDLPESRTPLETFLFDSRRGYCEYFASSFALVLRLAGVPARLVGGYLGGDYNPMAGYYLVGESRAHVWVEALDDHNRWRRIDPSRLAVNAAIALQSTAAGARPWHQLLDAAGYYWTRSVVTYDMRRQFAMLIQLGRGWRELGFGQRGWQKLLLLGFPLVLWGGWRLWRGRGRRDRYQLARYRRLIARRYGPKLAAAGLYAIAEQSGEPLCRRFAERLGPVLYAQQQAGPGLRSELRQLVRELERLRVSSGRGGGNGGDGADGVASGPRPLGSGDRGS